jgi:hypothetical protein
MITSPWPCRHQYLPKAIAKAPRCIHCGDHRTRTKVLAIIRRVFK